MSNVKTRKVANELVKIAAVNGMMPVPDSVCESNGEYLVGENVPTMEKQTVSVSLNVKRMVNGKFDRFAAKDLSSDEVADMIDNKDNWRVGYNVKFTKDLVTTYISAGDAKAQGFLTTVGEGANIWSASELGFEASGKEGVNGKFIA